MANPWDQDELVATANPWDADEVVQSRVVDFPAVQAERPDATEGMSGVQRFLAGAGKSLADSATGVAQVLSSDYAPLITGLPGLITRELGQRGVGQAANQRAMESRELDQDLLNTGAGLAGNVAGTLAQVLGPGIAARGTAAAPAFLPTTIVGNALQGAALGALQPAVAEGERGINALGGLAGGAAGGAIGRAGSAAFNAVANAGRRGISAADRGAANVLLREAADPNALQTVAPSSVPGVQRTLAEETLDPGIARLERTVRSTGGQFDALDRANNAARVGAIETFAQDENALRAATRSRNQQTEALRESAMQDSGVNVGAVREVLANQLERTATRPSVQSALLDVKQSLDAAGDDVFSLYGTRKYIDDLMSGKAGTDKSYAKAASRELMQIKNALDERLAEASPSFSQYLDKYREMSGPINTMQVGQALIGRSSGGAVLDPVTGVQVLTPAQFSKASRSLDDVAAKATGFKKAKADQILRPSDIAIIKSVQDDLERQAFRATAGSGGNSQTFERLGVQDRITRGAGREALGMVPGGRYITGFMDVLDKTKNEQLKERLAYLVANPEEARRVINSLNPAGRTVVQNAIQQLSGATGRSVQPVASD